MKILFFVQSEPTFNCFKTIHDSLIERGIDSTLIAVPHWNVPQNCNPYQVAPDNIAVKEVLEKNRYKYLDLESIIREDRIEYLRKLNPSCVILATKDEDHISKIFGISVEEFSSIFKVVYIPYYGATIIDNESTHADTVGHKNYWKFVADSNVLVDYYINHGIDKSNIINVGHPKIEEVYKTRTIKGEWSIQDSSNKLKIIWAPHWSCVEFECYEDTEHNISWRNISKFGTFLHMCWDFYSYTKENNDKVQVILRPHPLLQLWLRANGVHHEFRKFIAEWKKLSNTDIHLSGLYNESFAASDVMITDGISFLVEYPIATGKPIIFIDSGIHEGFNSLGKIAEPIWNIAKSFNDIKRMLNNVQSLKTGNITPLLNALLPHRDRTSHKIVDELLEHLSKEQ